MKFVYVLTSTKGDYYLEQAILSMHSLRMYNPDAHIILITEKKTIESLSEGRERIHEYLSELIDVKIPERFTPMQKSRYLKTSMRKYIKGDFLFIDTDTIICEPLDDLKILRGDMYAVLDYHQPIYNNSAKRQIHSIARKIGWNIPEDEKYYNSGVMWIKDSISTHKLFEDWHRNWLDGVERLKINIDQPMLALANAQNHYIIKELNGNYNCQIICNGLKYLFNAKIIHYFASGIDSSSTCPYILRDKNIYSYIRKYGIDERIENILKISKSAFSERCLIIGNESSLLYGEPLVSIARRISIKFPLINSLLYKILKKIGRI